MDRSPLFSKVILLTSLAGIASCGSNDTSKKEEDSPIVFPESQTREVVNHHTAVLPAMSPAIAKPIEETVPEEVVAPEPEPVTFPGFMQRGRLRFRAGDFDGAMGDYEAAVAKHPESARPRIQLARTLLSIGDASEARKHAELAIELDGSSSLAWNTMGRVELVESDFQAAIVSFERAVEENPDNSYAWNNLGFVFMEEQDYEAAVGALEQATSGGAPTGYMWNNLGMAYEHLDRIVEARAAYRQAVDAGSGKAQSNFERLEGVVSLVSGDDDAEETAELDADDGAESAAQSDQGEVL